MISPELPPIGEFIGVPEAALERAAELRIQFPEAAPYIDNVLKNPLASDERLAISGLDRLARMLAAHPSFHGRADIE
jgi:hypothetical protein